MMCSFEGKKTMKTLKSIATVAMLLSLFCLVYAPIANAEGYFSLKLETSERFYESGDYVYADLIVENTYDQDAVIEGELVPYQGYVFGEARLRDWDGEAIGSLVRNGIKEGRSSYMQGETLRHIGIDIDDAFGPSGTPPCETLTIPAGTSAPILHIYFSQVASIAAPFPQGPLAAGDYLLEITLDSVVLPGGLVLEDVLAKAPFTINKSVSIGGHTLPHSSIDTGTIDKVEKRIDLDIELLPKD